MRNKRIFISGGAGVIGTALVQQLLAQGADLFIGDLKTCPKQWLGKVKYRQGDLNTLTLEELQTFNPEFFFHLAATFERSDESYSFFEENFNHNIKLSHWLIHLLKQLTSLKRVIFASSYLIYDRHLYEFETVQAQPTVLEENASILPRNLCGSAKWMHEQELQFLDHFLHQTLSCLSVRIFRVYGRHSRDIISRWIRAALQDEVLTVYQPDGQFDYIFADDVATGLLKLAQTEAKGIVNLGKGHARSIHEVIAILKKYFPNLKTKIVASSIAIEQSQASLSRLNQLIQWQPAYSLETAIPLLIEEEKKQLTQELKAFDHSAVLITSISKKMPLICAVREAADKLGKFQIIHGCDSDLWCVGQYGVDYFWHCPPLDAITLEEIVSYCQKNQITTIIPTRDADCEFYAKHLAFFEKRGIYPLVSSKETIQHCLDKLDFAEYLQQAHYPAIPTFLSIESLKTTQWIVKEQKGAGSKNLGLNLNREEALQHAAHLAFPIFQPYIEGVEWSVDVYRSWEGRVKGCVARQRNYVVQGESQVTTTCTYPALEHLCQELANYLDIKGCAVFQVIEDKENRFHVIECNPRFGGASTASIAVGLDSFFWFFIERLGIRLQDYPFLRQQGEIRQIRYLTDRLYPWSSYST
jgi:carbamoyl-phosphate synthase large subunit